MVDVGSFSLHPTTTSLPTMELNPHRCPSPLLRDVDPARQHGGPNDSTRGRRMTRWAQRRYGDTAGSPPPRHRPTTNAMTGRNAQRKPGEPTPSAYNSHLALRP